MENKDKKNKEELKKKLHELIDGIEDEHILKVLNEDVIAYMMTTMDEDEDDEEDDLTEEQQKRLEQAIKEADEGKTISHEEFKKRMARWLPNIKE